MDDWVCVYSGNRLAAHSLAEALERAGLRAFESQETGFAANVHAGPAITRVLVPPEDHERAQRISTHWQTHHAQRVHTLSGRLSRVFALSLLAPVAWWGMAFALPERIPTPSPEAAGAVWLAGFVAVAQFESRRHRRERIEIGGPPT
jgi:hypothetical protein